MNYESTILSVYNSSEYQQLKEYYGKSTLFSTLGIARSENKHSAFLAWLFDAAADHKLGYEPLKKLLGLYALRSTIISNSMKTQLVTGHYNLTDICVSTEETLANYEGGAGMKDNQKRLDIVSSFTVVPAGMEDAPIEVVLVVENKIYSKESQPNGRMQTQIYHDCMSDYCNKNKKELFEIFLTPDVAQNPACEAYCKLTYQELLDSVITPLSFMSTDGHTSMMLADYIRNLGVPAFNMDDQDKVLDDYTIMATSKSEIDKLNALYRTEGFAELFVDTLLAKFENKALSILDEGAANRMDVINADISELLSEFWDANVNIFKAIMRYVDPYKDKDCDFLFKKSNCDNTKYRIRCDGELVFPEKRALSKTMTALAIFHAYVKKHDDISVHELNKVFPCKELNDYYFKNYYKDLFYFYTEQLHFDSDNKTHHGKDSRAVWDFYVKPSLLMDINSGTQKVMTVKMWRKIDFEKLLNHISSHPELFDGIVVEEI